jgi:dephospho-CoA kinase
LAQPFRVGLTGNIASGKSSVANVWRALGAHIIDADVLAREAIAPGTPGQRAVLAAFGTDDRAALRDIVFREPARRQRLEQIIHPEVARLRGEREAALAQQGVSIIVNDIPLLFEAGLVDEFQLIVLVDAPAEQRIARIVEHRGIDRAEAARMVAAQLPAERKRARADIVIDNDANMEVLKLKAEKAWQEIQARASA